MSDLIRIASGTVLPSTLLSTASYLVSNWTRQADMSASDYWSCSQPENAELKQEFRPGLEVGSGKFYGKVSGILEFYDTTEDMRHYIFETIMSSQPVAPVTVYAHHVYDGYQVYTGELVTPLAIGADSSYSRFSDAHYINVQYLFRRGTRTSYYLTQENGSYILQENGDKIILE